MKHFKQFFTTQKYIIIIFVVAMLIPNILLAITEPYRVSTIIASLFIPAAGYILWCIFVRKPGIMILLALPIMVLCAFQLVLLYMFGNSIIAVDMFTNLVTTNVGEASEVLNNITVAIIAVCVIYIPMIILGIVSIRSKNRLSKHSRMGFLIVATILLSSGFAMGGISKMLNKSFEAKYNIFPINVINNICVCVERWNKNHDYEQTSKHFKFNAIRTDSIQGKEVYLLVVGEASRAASWSMFGNERETTPHLDTTSNIVAFSDITTQSNTTHKSVPIILSAVSASNFDDIYYQKSIVTLFKEAGFKTMFISNQGENRSFIDKFGAEADSYIQLHNTPGTSIDHYDSDAIPYINKAIEQNTGKLFIVFHSYGSHFDFSKRYPREFAKFTPDNITSVNSKERQTVQNAYDNSILFTDYVLSEIIKTLKSDTTTCSAMLYCADHGDDIMDDERGRFLHASPTTTYYQLHVACFSWFSDRYKEHFPLKHHAATQNRYASATTAAVFNTIGDIAAINCSMMDVSSSLVSRNYVERERTYINDMNQPVNILNSGITDLDLKMFDKHKLDYNINDKVDVRY